MQDILVPSACLLIGLLLGGVAATLRFRPVLAAERERAETLSTQLAQAGAAQVQLADLRVHLSGLRHDVRGILSPALLVSDRLLAHDEPHVRRAGEVMVRTVERAAARLAEVQTAKLGLDQEAVTSARP